MPTIAETHQYGPGRVYWREGLHGWWEYDDLILNDRRTPDHYHLLSIDGLADADIRDPRTPWPSAHGEIALNSRYGGKTIVFEGEIRAGNVAKMRDMEAHLRDAFSRLVELPLYHRTFAPSWMDEFDDRQLIGYTFTSGSGTVEESNSSLNPTSLVLKSFTASNLKYADVDIWARFRTGTDISALNQRIILRWIDSNNWLNIGSSSSTSVILQVNNSNSVSSLATSTFDWQANTDYWMRARIAGNTVWFDADTEELDGWNEDDAFTYTLTGSNATKFGTGVEANCGINWDPVDAGEKLLTFKILPSYSTDRFIMCKKNAPLAIKEQQVDGKPYRRFMITLRASRPMMQSTIVKEIEVASVTTTALGRFYDRTYDLVYDTPMLQDGTPVDVGSFTSIINAGNFTAEPVYRVYGPITNPTIKNLTTGETIELDITVPANDLIQINSQDKTVFDSDGTNIFGSVKTFSNWPTLAEGVNRFQVFAKAWDTGARVVVFWRDTWQA
jgi:tail protein